MSGREQSGVGRPYHGAMTRNWAGLVRVAIGLTILAVLGWLGGCSDNPGGPGDPAPPPPPPPSLIVSDPQHASTPAGIAASPSAPSSSAASPSAPSSSADDEIAYVSLAPGTVPTGSRAIVRRVGDAATLTTGVFDGGFDPVPIRTQVGDSIHLIVTDAGGATIRVLGLVVTAARPPIVVRTQPPRKKRDVPVNAAIVVVFSEPVDGASVTAASIRLLQGTTAVAGTVRFVDATLGATELMAEFVPDAPLGPGTDYQLVVTRQVRDLDGDVLSAPDTVPFTTGQTTTGPPASLSLSPSDSVLFPVFGTSFQMRATVRDGAGNMLTDHPVTWSTDDTNFVTVSPTGLVTAIEPSDWVQIVASVDGLSKYFFVSVQPGPPASLTIAPTSAVVAVGDTVLLTAAVRDAAGHVTSVPITWSSSNSARASVSIPGFDQVAVVSGLAQGGVTITATSGAASGGSALTVGPPQPVASVVITPDVATLLTQGKVSLAATLRDANGRLLIGRRILWQSTDQTIATVDGNGVVTGVAPGSVNVTATSEGVVDSAIITVTQVTFVTLTAGYQHTCGVTSTRGAYCWGLNANGQLGAGSDSGPEQCSNPLSCSTTPAAVSGAIEFSKLSASRGEYFHNTCGIAGTGTSYCWGSNAHGQLGNGTITVREVTPVTVIGGLTFSTVSSGVTHTCGVTTTGAAYCWGQNDWGQLGIGTTSEFPPAPYEPKPVTGGLTFSTVSAGGTTTCGLTTAGALYCWGHGGGMIPGGDLANPTPVPVMSGVTLSAVTVGPGTSFGSGHVCVLTTAGAAFCWGRGNGWGQLGNDSASAPGTPVAVTGGLTFSSITAGGYHTCGVTVAGTAYCWGANTVGQLGFVSNPPEGSNPYHPAPEPVSGGLAFTAVSAGGSHTCGVTTTSVAYCWGSNGWGQLGDGTTVSSSVPIKVAGQP